MRGIVTGTINVNANASDNTGVVGVQFLFNGSNLGAEDVSAPYSVIMEYYDSPKWNIYVNSNCPGCCWQYQYFIACQCHSQQYSNLIAAHNFNEGSGTIAADCQEITIMAH